MRSRACRRRARASPGRAHSARWWRARPWSCRLLRVMSGQREEHVVEARLANGQGGGDDALGVEPAQGVDEETGALVCRQPNGRILQLGGAAGAYEELVGSRCRGDVRKAE